MFAAMSAASAGTLVLAGHEVPRLGYGTMRLTGPHIFGPPADRGAAVQVLRRAVELGVRVIDTAWYYGPYVAEEILAEALHPYADDLVIVSKLGAARGADGSWYSALSEQELRNGCEHDLRLLRRDSIPVVHLRWMPDSDVPFLDALATMIALRRGQDREHRAVHGLRRAARHRSGADSRRHRVERLQRPQPVGRVDR